MTGLPLQRSRSFAQSVFSYDGTRDYETVENFLTAARKYKAMKNMVDIDALRSLSFILKGKAATWWNESKDKIPTWNDFESQLRKQFSPKKPAYIIYQEISELRQKPDELTERFVAKQRALFNQLPSPGLSEEVQLDMMYGFLHPKIQEQIPRECINSFEGLLEAARGLEQEKVKDKPEVKTRKRVRCNFCRNFGHVAEVCRKRQKVEEANAGASKANTGASKSNAEASKANIGAPEANAGASVAKSEAPQERPASPETPSFQLKIASRLMIEISIGTAKEMAFVDTGSSLSVASHKLYSYLKNIGFHFQEESTTITLADGIPKKQNILTGRIPVKLRDRCVLTKFMVLPEAPNCDTLLGCEFLVDANIELNLPQLAWSFNDEPGVHYDLIEE